MHSLNLKNIRLEVNLRSQQVSLFARLRSPAKRIPGSFR